MPKAQISLRLQQAYIGRMDTDEICTWSRRMDHSASMVVFPYYIDCRYCITQLHFAQQHLLRLVGQRFTRRTFQERGMVQVGPYET